MSQQDRPPVIHGNQAAEAGYPQGRTHVRFGASDQRKHTDSMSYPEWRQQRGCDRKIGYHCELDANAAILRSYEKGDGPLRTYQCTFCGLLHLTSDVEEESA